MCFLFLPSGHPHSGGGGPETMHGQTLRGHRASLLLRGGVPHQVSLSREHQSWGGGAPLPPPPLSAYGADSSSVRLVCPHRSCILQADSEKLRQAWIKAVQNSIATAFRDKGEDGEVRSPSETGQIRAFQLPPTLLSAVSTRSWTGSHPHPRAAWTPAASRRRSP